MMARSAALTSEHFLAAAFCTVIAIRGFQGFADRAGLPWTAIAADGLTLLVALLILVRPRRRSWTVAAGFMFAYILWCSLSAVVVATTSVPLAVLGLRSMVLAPLTVLLFQSARLGPSSIRWVSRALLFVVAANAVEGMRQAAFGYSAQELNAIVATGSTYLVGDQIRLVGLQPSGQDFSIIVGAAFCWGMYQLLRVGPKQAGAFVTLTTILAGLSTFLVLQRSVLLGVAASMTCLAIIGLLSFRKMGDKLASMRRAIGLAAAVGAAGIVIAIVAPGQFNEAINRVTSFSSLSSDNSWAIRQRTTIPVTMELLSTNPWGYGVGSTGSVAVALYPASPLSAFPLGGLAADNGYFFVALQLGVLGACVWIAMLTTWAWQGKLVSQFEVARWSAAVVASFLLGSMVSGSFWGLASTMSLVLLFTSIDLPRDAAASTGATRHERAGPSLGRVGGSSGA